MGRAVSTGLSPGRDKGKVAGRGWEPRGAFLVPLPLRPSPVARRGGGKSVPLRLYARHRHAAAGRALTVNLTASLPRGEGAAAELSGCRSAARARCPSPSGSGRNAALAAAPGARHPPSPLWKRLLSSAAPLQRQRRGEKGDNDGGQVAKRGKTVISLRDAGNKMTAEFYTQRPGVSLALTAAARHNYFCNCYGNEFY